MSPASLPDLAPLAGVLVLLELAVGRYELIRDGDPEGAASLVRRYRDQIGVLNSSRFDHELVILALRQT